MTAGGFEAMSDSVQANLDRDEEYKAWYSKLHSIKEEEVEDESKRDGSFKKHRHDVR